MSCDFGTSQATLEVAAQGTLQLQFAPLSSKEHVLDFANLAPRDGRRYEADDTLLYEDDAQHDYELSTSVVDFWKDAGVSIISPISFNSTLAAMIDHSLQSASSSLEYVSDSTSWTSGSSWHFSESHLEIMERFQDRTATTIGG